MTTMDDYAIIACADLVGRAGASNFEIGYMCTGVPIDEAGWYAKAIYRGAAVATEEHRSPELAAIALAERLLTGALCKCRRPVSLSDVPAEHCRWRLMGVRWEPGCDAPPILVDCKRGDYAALKRAYEQAGQ